MKRKFGLVTLFIMLAQLNSFAQNSIAKMLLPLIAEDGITSITASGNIDVILIQDKPENVAVKASDNVLSKLNVSLVGENLSLAPAKELRSSERLEVYIWINDLENLTLKGNAVAVSRGILQGRNLHVSAATNAMVSLKSRDKVWFDTPANYQVVNEKGFFFVNASNTVQK